MRNLKKVIALVAVFAMLVSSVAFAQVFTDVADTDNYSEAIETLNTLGILTGDDENNDGKMEFRPEDTITRAEVTAIISRIQGMGNASQTTTDFTDVPSSHWASGYVSQAATQGIVNGYGDGTFGPDDNVTYEQIIKMLMETLGYYPFAVDNGGYPTGYLAAAQRYGVLDGVVGGGVGVEAKRGMVAQLVNNAIDTPLMDKYSYGKDAEYVIYNGLTDLGSPYQSLLTRDLKLVKVTGVVERNNYTTLGQTGTSYDADKTPEIGIAVDDTTDNYNYLNKDSKVTSYLNGTTNMTIQNGDVEGADDLLGYAVSLYAKKDSSDKYTLISISKSDDKNETVEFNFDLYKELKNGKITYYRDENSSSTSTVNIASNAVIVYNGAAAGTFADNGSNYLSKVVDNDKNSGKVVCINSKDATGYDVIRIEAGVSAVVSEVGSNGKVTFMNPVQIPSIGTVTSVAALDFADDDIMINITKDGAEFDYTELSKWDVVTILAYEGGRNGEVFNVDVLGEGGYVDGYVTSVKDATSTKVAEYKLSDGNWYKMADAFYPSTTLKSGKSGRFFVDAYGKLVALDTTVEVEGAGSVTTGNYAYVINAQSEKGTWGGTNFDIRVQILDKSGELYEAYLASNIQFVNLDSSVGLASSTDDAKDFSYAIKNLTDSSKASALANALKNNLITYSANSAGEIKAVTFASNNDDDDFVIAKNSTSTGAEYDLDTQSFEKGVSVNDDTLVFYIAKDGNEITYGNSTYTANKSTSKVSTAASLADGTEYKYIAFDEDEATGEVAVVVAMNTTGGISSTSNVAVIDSVGTSSSNGDTVYTVDFYMNGEFMSAVTTYDMEGEAAVAAADTGDIFHLNVVGDTITAAEKVMDYTGYSETDYSKAPVVSLIAVDDNNAEYAFGLVTKTSGSRITYAPYDTANSNAVDFSNTVSKNVGDANVYVYDSNLKNPLYVGSAGDAYADKILTDGSYSVYVESDTTSVSAPSGVKGMLNSVFIKTVNNSVSDVVVYLPYDFSYSIA